MAKKATRTSATPKANAGISRKPARVKPAGATRKKANGKRPPHDPGGTHRRSGTASLAAPTPAASPVSLEELFPNYGSGAFAKKVAEEHQRWVAELQRAYLSEGLVLYLGAGVSMSVGLPSWNELIHSLTVTMMSRKVKSAARALEGLKEKQQTAAVEGLLEEVKQQRNPEKPILMMARAIKDEMGEDLALQVALHLYRRLGGGFLLAWWWRFLGGIFKQRSPMAGTQTVGQLPTSPLLDAVVSLARPNRDVRGVQAIVNYNYDDIVEERLRLEAVPCVTVRSGKDKQPRGTLTSYHVHGVLPVGLFLERHLSPQYADTGNFVFSEDEYHTEYADPYRWSNLTQISLLGRHKGLFIGLSMQDPNLRRLIDVTHKQYPEIWNYAILPRTPPAPNEDTKGTILRNLAEDVEAGSFRNIGVKVIWVDNVKQDVAPVLDQIRTIPVE